MNEIARPMPNAGQNLFQAVLGQLPSPYGQRFGALGGMGARGMTVGGAQGQDPLSLASLLMQAWSGNQAIPNAMQGNFWRDAILQALAGIGLGNGG